MSALPSLSVIIPAHNEAAVIAEAIQSVQQEGYAPLLDIIIACNGCSDNTAEIAGKYNVTVLESEDSGMSFGKNLGGREARGKLLLFLDADTRLMPGSLEKIAQCASINGEVVGTLQAYLAEPTLLERMLMWIANRIQYYRRLPTPSGAIFISRHIYEAINGFSENLPQATSSDLAIRAREAGGCWCFLWDASAVTSPRRFRKIGMVHQMLSWFHNVRLLKRNKLDRLAQREYENVR
ncbi:MAG: glycosyltransferase [Planctomycetes bacterium]|nr:glycosyltransferase [Planctomycetota bacterium]